MCYDHINMGKDHIQHICTVVGCSKPSRSKNKPGLCGKCATRKSRHIRRNIHSNTFLDVLGTEISLDRLNNILASYYKHNLSPDIIMRVQEISKEVLSAIVCEEIE